MPDLSRRRPDLVELMDAPDADERTLHKTYDGFRLVNPGVTGWGTT